MAETTKDRQRAITASKARNLITEYGVFLQLLIDECTKEFDAPINETSVDGVAMQYMRREGGKEALKLFMKKLNSKTNE